MGRRRIIDVHRKAVARLFPRGAKKGDNGVCSLQWDDFYMLMKGLTSVKVTVENRFRVAMCGL